ncbi:MAG: hypothetical protein U0165_19700 [Polyangiaceae bacterium]
MGRRGAVLYPARVRRFFLLLPSLVLSLLCVSLLEGCPALDQLAGGGSDGGVAGTSGAAGSDAGSTTCAGFVDILGRCGDLSCLQTAACTNATVSTCGEGATGQGVCAGAYCAYVQLGSRCSTPADCVCGLCGQDGQCYTDQNGACGACSMDTGETTSPTESPACKSCLTDCAGTGPTCCAGCGCTCEGVCGVCN